MVDRYTGLTDCPHCNARTEFLFNEEWGRLKDLIEYIAFCPKGCKTCKKIALKILRDIETSYSKTSTEKLDSPNMDVQRILDSDKEQKTKR